MLQDMILNIHTSWLLMGILATLSIIYLWTKTRRPYTKYNIPPYPVKPCPIVGHFFLLISDTRNKFMEWRKLAGDIYSIDIAGQHVIALNGFDVIKDVLVKHAENIPNLQRNMGSDILHENNMGIVGARDENWKEQRTTSLAILRNFGVGKNIMAEKIQEEVAILIERLATFKEKSTDIRVLANASVSNVICSVIIGKRFEYEDSFYVDIITRVSMIVKYFPAIQLVTSFPVLYYLPGDLLNVKKWINIAIEINDLFGKAYVRELKKSFNVDEEPQNFITAYLQEMKKKEGKGEINQLSEANLVTIIKNLLVGGTASTSMTILWCLVYMLHHPEVQEKVYKEIETHVGTARVPNMADKPKLTYLNAVIMETQRVASLISAGFRREIKQSFEFRGFTFPKDSLVWSILDSVHFDKKIWGDPQNFRPERFIDKTGNLIHPEELIPFSIGKRSCFGESLARMELFLFLSAMFQRFRFEPDNSSKDLPSLKGVFGGTIVPKPFKLRFIERRR